MTDKEFSAEQLSRFDEAARKFEVEDVTTWIERDDSPVSPPAKTRLVSIRLPESIHEALIERARARQVSFSECVRQILARDIDKQEAFLWPSIGSSGDLMSRIMLEHRVHRPPTFGFQGRVRWYLETLGVHSEYFRPIEQETESVSEYKEG